MLKEGRITKVKLQTLDGDLVMLSKEDHEFTEQEVDKPAYLLCENTCPTFVVYFSSTFPGAYTHTLTEYSNFFSSGEGICIGAFRHHPTFTAGNMRRVKTMTTNNGEKIATSAHHRYRLRKFLKGTTTTSTISNGIPLI